MLVCNAWSQMFQSRAEHVIHEKTTKHCLVLQRNIKCIINTNSGKKCFSVWSFSVSVPSFIFAVKFLPSHSPPALLNHIIDSNW